MVQLKSAIFLHSKNDIFMPFLILHVMGNVPLIVHHLWIYLYQIHHILILVIFIGHEYDENSHINSNNPFEINR